MSVTASLGADQPLQRSATLFGGVALTLMVLAAALAAWLPLQFSIATVFLFAGPHNWIEARYFLTRMPPRWGKLGRFFLLGLAGVAVLTASFTALPWFGNRGGWDPSAWMVALACWNGLFLLWILLLIQMRSRQNPRRDWAWCLPAGLVVMALAFLYPFQFGLILVYAHPLMACWILDRELRLRRPEWRRAFHICIALVPVFLAVLWVHLANAPQLPGEQDDALASRIVHHAGADLLPGVSAHLLVATHTFLEMLHYSIWIVAIPLVGLRVLPWQLKGVPLACRSLSWKRLVAALLVVSAAVVLVLWVCFLLDYPTTRDVYFTVAMLHVLAEVPFLLRML
jgi:hypothetical protein